MSLKSCIRKILIKLTKGKLKIKYFGLKTKKYTKAIVLLNGTIKQKVFYEINYKNK